MNRIKKFLKNLGPGLVTGVADDDPSGIATYSQTGAQFGYNQLWAALFMLPLMVAIQEACARIGAVKGKGIIAVVQGHYSKTILYPMVLLILISNTINIGADIGAMAAAARLIVPIHFILYAVLFTAIILFLEVFVSYKQYAKILKWLCLFILAYPITLFLINAPWLDVLAATFIPHVQFDFQYLFIMTGLLGTTISPYLFIWEAAQEVEEERAKGLVSKKSKPQITKSFLQKLQMDNFVGMFSSQLCSWAIIVVTGTVLHTRGVNDISTAADAAKALEPFAGPLAEIIFAVGIIGLGMIAIPVLAGSAAYALSDAFHLRAGLHYKFKNAFGFYIIIILATCLGLLMNFMGIDPMKALIYSAVINGVTAVPLIMVIALVANDKKIMGQHKSGLLSNIVVWITFIGMLLSVCGMFVSFFNA